MTLDELIAAALKRIAAGHSAMRIPADPTDPDLVLLDCREMIAELRAGRDDIKAERDALKAEVADWRAKAAARLEGYRALTTQVQELEARLDALRTAAESVIEAARKAYPPTMESSFGSCRSRDLREALSLLTAELAAAKGGAA